MLKKAIQKFFEKYFAFYLKLIETPIEENDYLNSEGACNVILLVRSCLKRYDLALARICEELLDAHDSESQKSLASIDVIEHL